MSRSPGPCRRRGASSRAVLVVSIVASSLVVASADAAWTPASRVSSCLPAEPAAFASPSQLYVAAGGGHRPGYALLGADGVARHRVLLPRMPVKVDGRCYIKFARRGRLIAMVWEQRMGTFPSYNTVRPPSGGGPCFRVMASMWRLGGRPARGRPVSTAGTCALTDDTQPRIRADGHLVATWRACSVDSARDLHCPSERIVINTRQVRRSKRFRTTLVPTPQTLDVFHAQPWLDLARDAYGNTLQGSSLLDARRAPTRLRYRLRRAGRSPGPAHVMRVRGLEVEDTLVAMSGRGRYAIATTFGTNEFSIPGPDPVTVLLASGRVGTGSTTIVAAEHEAIEPIAVATDRAQTTSLMFTDAHRRILVDERALRGARLRTHLNRRTGCNALPRLIFDTSGHQAATWFCEHRKRAFIRFRKLHMRR